MYSKAKLFGHPIHPMLVAFPVAFYTGTLAAFLEYGATNDTFWLRLAKVVNWAGVVMALVAALPGFVDWATGIPRQSGAKRTGLVHMALNVTALAVFFVNALVYENRAHEMFPQAGTGIALSAIGVLLTLAAGFLGWSMVQNHHVGVNLSAEQERLEPAVPSPAPDDRHHPTAGPSYAGR